MLPERSDPAGALGISEMTFARRRQEALEAAGVNVSADASKFVTKESWLTPRTNGDPA